MKFYQVALYDLPRGSMRPLAARLGMTYDLLLAIRNGRVNPKPHELKAIAFALGKSAAQLTMDVPAPVEAQEVTGAR